MAAAVATLNLSDTVISYANSLPVEQRVDLAMAILATIKKGASFTAAAETVLSSEKPAKGAKKVKKAKAEPAADGEEKPKRELPDSLKRLQAGMKPLVEKLNGLVGGEVNYKVAQKVAAKIYKEDPEWPEPSTAFILPAFEAVKAEFEAAGKPLTASPKKASPSSSPTAVAAPTAPTASPKVVKKVVKSAKPARVQTLTDEQKEKFAGAAELILNDRHFYQMEEFLWDYYTGEFVGALGEDSTINIEVDEPELE